MRVDQKMKQFLAKYGNSNHFLARDMNFLGNPHLQRRAHLAGYTGWRGGNYYFFFLPDVMRKIFSDEEIELMVAVGIIDPGIYDLTTNYDIFDKLRDVELFAVRYEVTGSYPTSAD